MSSQTLSNIANILREKYGNTIVRAFTQYGPGGWLGVNEQSMLGMLQQMGKVYVGGKDAPQPGSGGYYAAEWPIHTATATAASYDASDNWPSATPETYGALAKLNYKRYAISMEVDNMLRVSARGANVVGNVDAFTSEFESKLRSLISKIETDLHADGTGNSGKNIDGVLAFLSASNTYAGISQSANSFWQASVIAAGSAAISHSLIRQMIRALWAKDAMAGNYVCLMPINQWHRYLALHENLIQYRPGDQAGVNIIPHISDGFVNLPVYVLPQVTSSEIWFLNMDNIELRFASHERAAGEKGVMVEADNYQGLPIGIEPVETNKDSSAIVIKAYAQLVYLNPRCAGLISGLAT
jgi:hypothetical protein